MKIIICALSFLLTLALTNTSAQAQLLTKYEKEGPCKIRITVPIEIYGSGATKDFAFEIQKNVRDQWSGPSAEDAAVIGSTLGLDVDWYAQEDNADWLEKYLKKNKGAIDPKVNRDGTQKLVEKADQIRGVYADYVREIGADPACIQGECCALKVVADVKIRKATDAPTPGYYQIEIIDDPNFRSFVWAYDKARPGIENPVPKNPDHYQAEPTTEKGSNGTWANNAADNAAAHEVGHLMGLMDQYTDIKNGKGKTISSFQQHGHRHDIMAQSSAFPFHSSIKQLYEIGGIKCDEETCCPSAIYDGFGQDFGQSVLAAGDAIQVCDKKALRNILKRLEGQRQNLILAKGIPSHRKIALLASLDEQAHNIKSFEKRL